MCKKTIITYNEFQQKAVVCTTHSARYRPSTNEKAYVYESTVGEYLKGFVYPVYYVNSNKTELVGWDHTDANPILFSDFVKRNDFMRQLLDGWYNESLGSITRASVVSLRCSDCARSVVIDSVHRLAWLGEQKKVDALVAVTELSGGDWPNDTPDLKVICECKNIGR